MGDKIIVFSLHIIVKLIVGISLYLFFTWMGAPPWATALIVLFYTDLAPHIRNKNGHR